MNLNSLERRIVPILKKHGVQRAGLFGSIVRGEAKKESDIDLLESIKNIESFSQGAF